MCMCLQLEAEFLVELLLIPIVEDVNGLVSLRSNVVVEAHEHGVLFVYLLQSCSHIGRILSE